MPWDNQGWLWQLFGWELQGSAFVNQQQLQLDQQPATFVGTFRYMSIWLAQCTVSLAQGTDQNVARVCPTKWLFPPERVSQIWLRPFCWTNTEAPTVIGLYHSTNVWSNTNIIHANEKNKTKLVSGPIFSHPPKHRRALSFSKFEFYKVCKCLAHSPHRTFIKNYNFQIDGISQFFGVWVWQLVHLLILVCSFQWCVNVFVSGQAL